MRTVPLENTLVTLKGPLLGALSLEGKAYVHEIVTDDDSTMRENLQKGDGTPTSALWP